MRQSPFVLFDKATGQSPIELTKCEGFAAASLAITGQFVGAVRFWGSLDGDAVFPIQAFNRRSGLPMLRTDSAGLFQVDCRTLTFVGCDLTDWQSGEITIRGKLSE